VTFNIEYAKRIDAALAALRSHPDLRGADVLALQEMDAPGVERIARELGLNYVYYPASLHPGTRRDVGNAILSPWPLDDDRKLLLPHRSRVLGQGRAAVTARVLVAGRPIRVYSVHLGSPLGTSGGNRRQQAEVILADARAFAEPVLVAGDFNSSSVGRLFEGEGFVWPTKGKGATTRRFSFDHVLARGLVPRAVAGAGVAREVRDASDHRPVWAVLLLR
jgi:endonuclease/exonuclease/phosphatase family metal-dependent hydrolase